MTMYRIALIFILCGVFTNALAYGKCTQADAKAAEEKSSTIANWSQLHIAFNRFKSCDDGAIGEGYSDSVVRLLTEQWDGISELQKAFSTSQSFEIFILRHIDELMTPSQLTKIESNATNRCPSDAKEFCRKILGRIGEIRSTAIKP